MSKVWKKCVHHLPFALVVYSTVLSMPFNALLHVFIFLLPFISSEGLIVGVFRTMDIVARPTLTIAQNSASADGEPKASHQQRARTCLRMDRVPFVKFCAVVACKWKYVMVSDSLKFSL